MCLKLSFKIRAHCLLLFGNQNAEGLSNSSPRLQLFCDRSSALNRPTLPFPYPTNPSFLSFPLPMFLCCLNHSLLCRKRKKNNNWPTGAGGCKKKHCCIPDNPNSEATCSMRHVPDVDEMGPNTGSAMRSHDSQKC